MARPREFDPGEALQKVKEVFWHFGYEGTSIRDIEAETSLKKQSLYRFFGDKREMYRMALADYGQKEALSVEAYLKEPGTAHARLKALFYALIEGSDTEIGRRGCFVCNAAIDQSQQDEQTQRIIAVIIDSMLKLFEEALADTEPYRNDLTARSSKAASLLTAYNGLRVLIKAGQSKALLYNAANSMLEII